MNKEQFKKAGVVAQKIRSIEYQLQGLIDSKEKRAYIFVDVEFVGNESYDEIADSLVEIYKQEISVLESEFSEI